MTKQSVLASYVYQLAELPLEPPVIFDGVGQQKLVNRQRANWLAISLWLRNLLLGEVLAEEAYMTEMLYMQPRAELMAAEFRLAVGVHSRSAHPIIRIFESPADLWYVCQVQLSYGLLQDKGLLEPPKIKGKTERLNKTRKFIGSLENQKFTDWEEERATSYNVQLILVTEAQEIAKTDANFAATYYNQFLKQFKRSVNAEKNSKQLQDLYLLPNGQLYQTTKGGSLPKSNVKKNNRL